ANETIWPWRPWRLCSCCTDSLSPTFGRRRLGRRYESMQTLKRLFWDARAELKSLLLWICGAAPGGAGVRLRRLVYRRYLQRLGANTVFQSGLRIASPERVSIGANCN